MYFVKQELKTTSRPITTPSSSLAAARRGIRIARHMALINLQQPLKPLNDSHAVRSNLDGWTDSPYLGRRFSVGAVNDLPVRFHFFFKAPVLLPILQLVQFEILAVPG